MIKDDIGLKQLKHYLIESSRALFRFNAINLSIFGYGSDLKKYCGWVDSLGKLKDCIFEIGTNNPLPNDRERVNLIKSLKKAVR